VYTLLSVFVIGISFGFILFLLGAGLSLTMGLMRIVNMAHGALYMVGAYVGLATAKYTGSFWIGLLAGALITGLIGVIMEAGFIRRLYKQRQSQVLLTIGFVYILTNLVQWIWGSMPLAGVTPDLFSGYIQIGKIGFPVFRLAIIGFGLVMAILLWLFQEKTRTGAIVRAGMDNREVTIALGINLKVVFTGIFALGAFVAGFCGLMGAPLMGVNLQVGWETLLLSMIVVIVGGTGSIQGALLGGLLIGLLDAFGTAFFPQFAYFVIYVALIVILLFKPSGLMGRGMGAQQTADQLQSVQPPTRLDQSSKFDALTGEGRPWEILLRSFTPFLAVGLLLSVLPFILPSHYLGMVTKVLIFAIFAISLDLIMGYGGLLSLGHAAFLGIAGYTVGILTVKNGIDLFWIVVPLTILISAAAAAIIGYISLRVSGTYFLLITVAFGQLLAVVATKWEPLTGGTSGLIGIPPPNLGIQGFTWTGHSFYYLVFIAFCVCFLVLYRIVNSSFGRALVGIRENEMRMRSLGFNTWALKYITFILGGAFASVAGILFAYFYRAMVPDNLTIETSASVLLMVIIGGPGTLFGPLIGAAIVVLISYVASIYVPERWPLFLGIIYVVCVMFVRGGFARYLSGFWRVSRFRKAELEDIPKHKG
jgi:branched-chain amino acid transport system permease protein